MYVTDVFVTCSAACSQSAWRIATSAFLPPDLPATTLLSFSSPFPSASPSDGDRMRRGAGDERCNELGRLSSICMCVFAYVCTSRCGGVRTVVEFG